MNKVKKFFGSEAFHSVLASLICITAGLLVGFIVLFLIDRHGAVDGILSIIKNNLNFNSSRPALKYLGNTLAKTAPLVMCSLSVMFCYKVGMFNIGVAGQFTAGACISLYAAIAWNMPWWACLIYAVLAGALAGVLCGILKAKFNVNEVISGIMLNWIFLYMTNAVLSYVKDDAAPYTKDLFIANPSALIPSMGLEKLFSGNKYVTISLFIVVVIAILVLIITEKTRFGYELKATGYNKNAAKYCGMNENLNIITSLAIGGALAGAAGSFFYQCGYEQWLVGASSVPTLGFSGIAAAFLGGLNPIGIIFSSYFVQHITDAGAFVDRSVYCREISDLISAIIIYFCGFSMFIRNVVLKHREKKEEI